MDQPTSNPTPRERNFGERYSDGELPINETHGLIASDKVEGTVVYNYAGERLGLIHNFMVGKQSGVVEYAVLTFGGFLGIGRSFYPLPWEMLNYDTDHDGYLVDMDEDDLKKAPNFKPDAEPEFDNAYTSSVQGHYGR